MTTRLSSRVRWRLYTTAFFVVITLLIEGAAFGAYKAGMTAEFRWWQPIVYLPGLAGMWFLTAWLTRRMEQEHRVACSIRDLTPRHEDRRWLKGQGVLSPGRLTFIPGPAGNLVVSLAEVRYRLNIPVDSITDPQPLPRRGIRWGFKLITLQLDGPGTSYELRVQATDGQRVKAELNAPTKTRPNTDQIDSSP